MLRTSFGDTSTENFEQVKIFDCDNELYVLSAYECTDIKNIMLYAKGKLRDHVQF